MAGTGVLPFIRGIDLTLNNLEDDRFPEVMEDMVSLRWLKLTDTRLKKLPIELEKLKKLEHLTLKRNALDGLSDVDFTLLPCLRTLNLSRNALTVDAIPPKIFANEDLTTLDLSHNQV
jgi:Leucine-rich repeat (LRR) protein